MESYRHNSSQVSFCCDICRRTTNKVLMPGTKYTACGSCGNLMDLSKLEQSARANRYNNNRNVGNRNNNNNNRHNNYGNPPRPSFEESISPFALRSGYDDTGYDNTQYEDEYDADIMHRNRLYDDINYNFDDYEGHYDDDFFYEHHNDFDRYRILQRENNRNSARNNNMNNRRGTFNNNNRRGRTGFNQQQRQNSQQQQQGMFQISIPNDNYNARSRLNRGFHVNDFDLIDELDEDFELDEFLGVPANVLFRDTPVLSQLNVVLPLKPVKPKLKKQAMTTKLYVKNDNTKKLEAPTCCICLTVLKLKEDVCKLPCQHIFHYKCIDKWVETKQECPYCRGKIEEQKVSDKKKKK